METSDHFGTSKFKESDLENPIERIHLCGYVNKGNEGDNTGRSPTNHWVIFLQMSPKTSVKIDMIPGDGEEGLQGYIVVESKKYRMTNRAIKSITFEASCKFLVKDVFKVITNNGRERYMFTKEEEGCRYWVCTVVRDLEDAGKIEKESAALAVRTLSNYWSFPDGSSSREMESGEFF